MYIYEFKRSAPGPGHSTHTSAYPPLHEIRLSIFFSSFFVCGIFSSPLRARDKYNDLGHRLCGVIQRLATTAFAERTTTSFWGGRQLNREIVMERRVSICRLHGLACGIVWWPQNPSRLENRRLIVPFVKL